jgi:NADH-quinone oxidoreductase subunit E
MVRCDWSSDVCSSDLVVGWFEAATGIKMGQTTADGKLSLFFTSCVGACDIGPVAKIGDDVFGNLTADKVKTLVKCCLDDNKQELRSLCQN